MKGLNTDFLTIIVLFAIIILLTVWFSTTPAYIPYSSSIVNTYGRYEGFSTSPLEYSSVDKNIAMDGSISNYSIIQPTSGPHAVRGFNGMGIFNTPDIASKEELDIFSKAKGSLTTEGSGYYNSQGPLIMDDNMKKMLSTRGMNASGEPSTIGGAAV